VLGNGHDQLTGRPVLGRTRRVRPTIWRSRMCVARTSAAFRLPRCSPP